MTIAIPFAAVAAPAASAPDEGRTVTTRLPNGLTVLVKEDHRFPLVSLRLYVHAGSAYERPEEAGISHLLEHMVFKGTEERPKGQVAAEVEATGGYLNAATSFDYTFYLTDMTSEHWKTGMDVLKDMAFHPTLDPAELESEKDVVVAELNRGEDNPGQRIFRMVLGSALKGTPYERPIIGYEDTVRAITADDMRAYISRLYQPQSMLLVVCGDISAEEVTQEASRLFGDLQNTHVVIPPSTDEPQIPGFTATVEQGPWNKVHLAIALPAPNMNDARSAQLDVLAQVLGGDATSRLYRSYKYEKRLVDTISVSNYSFERTGLLFIRATLDADKLSRFWQSITRDLAQLKDTTFSQEELSRAKLNLEDNLFRSKETLAGATSKLAFFSFFSGGDQGEENYLRIMRDTDQRVLLELIQEFVKPESLSLVTLMPEGTALADQLPEAEQAQARKAGTDWQGWFTQTIASNWPVNAAAAEAAASAQQTRGEAEIVELGQGRKLILMPDQTLPYASVNMVFTGGESLLSTKNQGLATFTASLLGKGTKGRSATEIEDFLSDRASSLGASSGRQTFLVSMDYPDRFADDMFALLQETLTRPAFAEDEAVRVRENIIAAITAREDQPTGLAFRRMFPFLFPDHSYGYLQQGEKKRVAEYTPDDAASFWKEQAKQPWVLSICGTFDRDAVIAAAKALPAPSAKTKTVGVPDWGKTKELDLTLPGRNQAHLMLVFPTVGVGDKDEPGLELMQNILAGQSGLLFRDLRDKQGLGYTVTAFPWTAQKAGAIIFYIGTEPDKLQQAEDGFRKVIRDLQEQPLLEEELERGKNQMEGDYYRGRQTLDARSSEAALLTIMGRPLNAAKKTVEDAQSVTAEQLQELARTYLVPERAYVVKVLP